jgi:uncharacterized protein YuzE
MTGRQDRERENTTMRMTYSADVDAFAAWFGQGVGRVVTRELGPGIHADFDERGTLVGIEVLDASTHYERQALEQLASPIEYLTLAEASRESKLAVNTLRNQINNGRLPAIKRGRDWLVAGHELWNYLESRAPQGRPAAKRAARRNKQGRNGEAPEMKRQSFHANMTVGELKTISAYRPVSNTSTRKDRKMTQRTGKG